MAAGPITSVEDVIVPEIFTPYVQQLTEEKARLVQSGVLGRSSLIDQKLAGGGLTFNVPSWQDLDSSDADRVSTDAAHFSHFDTSGTAIGSGTGLQDPQPFKTQTAQEIAVRLSRNASWSSADLAAALAGEDPMNSIASRVAFYWARRLQQVFIATWQGVSRDNIGTPSGTGTQDDLVQDIAGAAFNDGVTTFSAEAFLDAAVTMGDSQENLTAVMVHSVVYNRMQKNNLIDFIPDSTGRIQIPTFLGREVIVDDGMPNGANAVRDSAGGGSTDNVYETWLFGAGAAQLGVGSPKVATEVERKAGAGNGGGEEVLYSRVEWSVHPEGHAYAVASPDEGGPDNTNTANNLGHADSWDRVFPERKQIAFARLVTREA